jgi:uncharacterized protein (TIGR02452 family)
MTGNRTHRAALAAETVAAIDGGSYVARSGKSVDISLLVTDAVGGTSLYVPNELRRLRERLGVPVQHRHTIITVANESTLTAARRLVQRFGEDRVMALNFASARNPGGGFLGGSLAQEEALACASGLYACQLSAPTYYDVNRHEKSALYTDHMIYSPRVPIIRDDLDGHLLDEPWCCSMLTAPAPNAGAVRLNSPHEGDEIEPTMRRRIDYALTIAAQQQQAALVLGAWGCGVFQNDPVSVAAMFREALTQDPTFTGRFEYVAFAVLDRRGDVIAPFASVFSGE